MWKADQWKDYEVLDTSDGEKLERWGSFYPVSYTHLPRFCIRDSSG